MPGCAYIGSLLRVLPATPISVVGPGVPTVKVNGIPVSVLGDDTSDGGKMIEGSTNVTVNGKPICRLGDKNDKGRSIIANVSLNVTINGI